MDTYPYADYDAMSNWMKIEWRYPNTILLRNSVTEPAYTAVAERLKAMLAKQ